MKTPFHYFGKKKRLKRIAHYYDRETPKLQSVLGDAINASRTENLKDLHCYHMKESGMKDGMKMLDAGCGICGPSTYFASHLRVDITAITISDVQYKIARDKIAAASLLGNIRLILDDYNRAGELFPPGSLDLVYFGEAFCYAENPVDMLNTVFKLLKPGGILYMKDFFLIDDLRTEKEDVYNTIVKKINAFYATNLTYEYNNINSFSRILYETPFEVKFIRKPLYKTDNYCLYKVYQGMNDLGSEMNDVIKVFDFFEVKAIKPLSFF